jgi:hypothetical protein
MSDPGKVSAKELHARLRDLAIPWEEGHRLAVTCAGATVVAMRKTLNEFAENDPYETGRLEPSAPKDGEPAVAFMTGLFARILNRHGLLKIDPH